jgi:hypothetical protein
LSQRSRRPRIAFGRSSIACSRYPDAVDFAVVKHSLTGYVTSVGAAGTLQIRNLLSFLAQQNVITLLVSVQHGVLGSADVPTVAMSYLAAL